MASIAKKRKMNFSEREVEIIVEEIEKQKHTLVNHFNAGVTHMAKNGAWLDILKKVNAVTTCPRELPEVKKKWSDMKTEVRRKVAQARAAIEGTATDCTPVPVILTAMQQRICNLLGEATIISLPAGDSDPELSLPVTVTTTVTLAETLPGGSVCEEVKPANAETTYHTLEDGGVVEYCTTTVSDSAPSVAAAVEAPAEMLASSSASPPPPQAKPQELKSRIALNSARLLQEQRVTNVHIRQIAQHLEGQNELLLLMRRSQEAQAFAQERQAQALEGTQAALLALVQMLRPALKDLRKFLQSGTEGTGAEGTGAERTGAERTGAEGTGAERTGAEGTGAERTGAEGTGPRAETPSRGPRPAGRGGPWGPGGMGFFR
ncbi:nuclear apoptosis-inducing factor 1 [Pseudoliparis swirei]|uniref:nuclear apoptosis-inducing factor 1 n=1 Tax=Pseudoliparis swirei TaxID=2059687 RepID=UPI0024BD6C67|nr:nuclear apoptosis-inducing factor 1 [Pseudoliparis swirei]